MVLVLKENKESIECEKQYSVLPIYKMWIDCVHKGLSVPNILNSTNYYTLLFTFFFFFLLVETKLLLSRSHLSPPNYLVQVGKKIELMHPSHTVYN